MILWILALVLVACVVTVNYYQGAVRAAFSLCGLLLAAMLALPLSGLLIPVLGLVGVGHPAVAAFVAPVVTWVLILAAFKVAGLTVHRKVDTYFKYKESETERLLFERLNQRLGICLGVANGVIYVLVICTLLNTLGYVTVQVASESRDTIGLRAVNFLAGGVRSSGMDRAVARFMPKSETFYDIADILGLIYHNPLIQSRLSTYPVFLTLAEKPEFQAIANDVQFQEFWQRQPPPTVAELIAHEKVQPLVSSAELFTNAVALLGADLKDFKAYLETGKSEKYDSETILGRWEFDYRASLAASRKRKAAWTTVELTRLRNTLGNVWAKSGLTATIDQQVILRMGNSQAVTGRWKNEGGGRYTIRASEGGRSFEVEAIVEGRRMTFTRDGIVLVFEK
ncbi:MAG TPA: CvpA family protein [Methylomirabilota bacterium]|nr:CvpA family protein [Methylomirabilota bacterium]